MYENLNTVFNELAYLPVWVGIVAMFESLAFVGLFVPGVVILMGLAVMAGEQQVSVPVLLIAGALGAFIGDALGFWLGRYMSKPLLTRWPLKKHKRLVRNGQDFFMRYGAQSVVMGRFIGPIRPVVPFAAGMMGMSAGQFSVWNLASALAWSPAYLLPGYYLGQQGWALLNQWGWLVAATALAGSLFYWFRRRYS